MNHPRNLQLIYSSGYHLLLKWGKKITYHRVNFLNSLIFIFKPLQFFTSNLNVVSDDLLSFHCDILCPSRLISLAGNLLESQEDFIIFNLRKRIPSSAPNSNTYEQILPNVFFNLGIDGKEEEKRTSKRIEQISQFMQSLWFINNEILLYNLNIII